MPENGRVDLEKSRADLIRILLERLPKPGVYPTLIDGLTLCRFNSSQSPKPCIYEPMLIIVVQGKKWVRIGARDIPYGENTCFITGINMPATSCVLESDPDRPYLAMSLSLDKSLIATLSVKVPPAKDADSLAPAGAAVQEVSPELLDAFLRLLELENSESAPVLGSLIYQEIHYRLLISPFGSHLRQLNSLGSQSNQINQAIVWLKENYKQSLHVEELAGRLNMATSTFHKYFKEITTLSPLQYQKRLRLSEAQHLMLAEKYDVTQAAFAVGYESVTQFIREYKRLYGESPRKDITNLKISMNRSQNLALV
jgi:AraC-like DNA-binding protein